MSEYANQRSKLIFLMSTGAISIIFLVIGGYQLLEFTDSTAFCGRLCHEVMKPQFTTHQASPHSRVKCVDCHVGSGGDYLVQTKISGIPLVFRTMTDSYHKPIPSPVPNLRPARDTCEQCHRPERFAGDIVRVHTTFDSNEGNTEHVDTRIMKVGGGESGVARDIHWHIAAEVWYLPLDEKRQEIAWVSVEPGDGEPEEYINPKKTNEITAQRVLEEKRLMDCIDCHNRATHVFRSPDDLINTALVQGKIDKSLPFIKREGLKALNPPNSSLEQAFSKIEAIKEFYRTSYPEIYQSQLGEIDASLAELREIARLTTFPRMKVTWDTYLNNIGHEDSPGCFRCHSNLVATTGEELGKVIEARCDLCHLTVSK